MAFAELAEEVSRLRAEVADLRDALRHARDLAEHERRMREVAEDAAARAWRVATTWSGPHPQSIHPGKKG